MISLPGDARWNAGRPWERDSSAGFSHRTFWLKGRGKAFGWRAPLAFNWMALAFDLRSSQPEDSICATLKLWICSRINLECKKIWHPPAAPAPKPVPTLALFRAWPRSHQGEYGDQVLCALDLCWQRLFKGLRMFNNFNIWYRYQIYCPAHAGAEVSKKWNGYKKSMAYRICLRCRSNEVLKLWGASMSKRSLRCQWNYMEKSMHNWPNEPLNQWNSEPMKQRSNESMNEWTHDHMNEWMNWSELKRVEMHWHELNDWISEWNEWMNEVEWKRIKTKRNEMKWSWMK